MNFQSNRTDKKYANARWLRLAAGSISIVLLGVLLATVEAATWFHHNQKMGGIASYKPQHLNDFYRFYRVNPKYRSERVRINTAGFRNDEEVTEEKPNKIVRIVMMGGSTVWGDDAHYPFSGTIDNRETIAAQLEALLNARAEERKLGLKVQVINAGVMGYMLFQDLIYFNHQISRFHPDVVIAIDGHNDLDAFKLQLEPYHHRNDRAIEQALNQPTLSDVFRYFIKYGEDKSLFLRKAYSRLSEIANQRVLKGALEDFDVPATEAEMEQWLNEYIATVRRFDASVRIAGGHALFAVQLEAVGERYKILTSEEEKIRQYWGSYKWLHTVGRDRLIARMKDESMQHGFWFDDVTDATKDVEGQVYLDYTHLTAYGSRIMAERLAKSVEKVILQ